MTPIEKHIEMVEAVNNAKTQDEHDRAYQRLVGFREACEVFMGRNVGRLLMSADEHYIAQGIDRPMCCGEFLDWRPA